MTYEKFIKDERGQIRIVVTLVVLNFGMKDIDGHEYRWDVNVWHTPKGKRTEKGNDSIATPAEIWEAKTRLWQQIKP